MNADTEEEKSISEISEIIQDLTRGIADTISNISNRLPAITLQLQKDVKEIVARNHYTEILTTLKDDIAKMLPVGGAGVVKCGKFAATDVEKLSTDMQTMEADCISGVQDYSEDMKTQMNVLLEKANALPQGVVKKIQDCVQDSQDDAIALATCLKSEIHVMKETLNELHTEAKNAMDMSERVAADVITAMRECIFFAQEQTQKYAQILLSNTQSCMSEL